MMKRILGLLALVASVGFAEKLPSGVSLCGPGDGPSGLTDITGAFSSNLRVIGTIGEVREFLLWEKMGSLVYRNADNRVIATRLSDEKQFPLTTFDRPIARFADPRERYLIGARQGWFYDAERGRRWIRYQSNAQALEPLFWQNDNLFTMESIITTQKQVLKLYRYSAGSEFSVRLCSNVLEFELTDAYVLGQGHHYPHVFLYQVKDGKNGKEFTGFDLNVESCQIRQKTYCREMPGPVQSAYWFEGEKSVAVKVDHPEKNLMWDKGGDLCRYFKVDNSRPYMLNPKQPVLANWDPKGKGINLMFLNRGVAANVLESAGSIDYLAPEDIYLTNAGDRLFIAPTLKDDNRKLMMEIKLK